MLADCPDNVLHRIFTFFGGRDLFIFRQVSKNFKKVADSCVRRVAPDSLNIRSFRNAECVSLRACKEEHAISAVISILQSLPRLSELLCWQPHVPDGAQLPQSPVFSQLTRLSLDLRGNDGPGQDVGSIIASCRSLKRLQIEGGTMALDAVRAMVNNAAPSLIELDVNLALPNKVVPAGELLPIHTGKLEVLRLRGRGLWIFGTGPDPFFFSKLAACTSVLELDLSNNPVGSSGISALSQLCKVTALNLRNTFVTHEGLQQLAALTAIRELNVSETSLTRWGLAEGASAAIQSFPHLTSLEAVGDPVVPIEDRERPLDCALLAGLIRLHVCAFDLPQPLAALSLLRELHVHLDLHSLEQTALLSGTGSLISLHLTHRPTLEMVSVDAPRKRLLLTSKHLGFLPGMPALQELSITGKSFLTKNFLATAARAGDLRVLRLPLTTVPFLDFLDGLEGSVLEALVLLLPEPDCTVDRLPRGLQVAYCRGMRRAVE